MPTLQISKNKKFTVILNVQRQLEAENFLALLDYMDSSLYVLCKNKAWTLHHTNSTCLTLCLWSVTHKDIVPQVRSECRVMRSVTV